MGGFSDVLVDYGYKLLVCNFIGIQVLEEVPLYFERKDSFRIQF